MDSQAVDEALVEALYGTALHDGDWRPALERFRLLLGSAETSISSFDAESALLCLDTTGRVLGPDDAKRYSTYYGRMDPKARILAAGGPGFLFNDAEHFDEDFVARDPFYQEFSRDVGTRHTLDLFVEDRSGRRTYLAAMRTKRQGAYGDRAGILLRQASRHFVRALALKEKLDAARAAQRALDRLQFGIIVLDGLQRVVLANRTAVDLISHHPDLRLCGGQFSARSPANERRLEACIAAALAGRGSCAKLSAARGAPQCTLWSAPLQEDAFVSGLARPAVLLAFGNPAARRPEASEVAARYGLSKAEARVAVALAEGATPDDIARHHGVKTSTVRTQLLSVLHKMGVHRQADVTRLLLAGMEASPISSAMANL